VSPQAAFLMVLAILHLRLYAPPGAARLPFIVITEADGLGGLLLLLLDPL
jgi:hypothetical protein